MKTHLQPHVHLWRRRTLSLPALILTSIAPFCAKWTVGNDSLHAKAVTWATTLYPSTVSRWPFGLSVLALAHHEHDENVVLSHLLPSGELPKPHYAQITKARHYP